MSINDVVAALRQAGRGHETYDKPRAKHTELAAGVRTPANYTVEQCLKDWLVTLNTQAESTVTGYRIMVRHLVERLSGWQPGR